MKKRIIAVLLTLCLVCSLSACRSKKDNSETSTRSSVEISSEDNTSDNTQAVTGDEAGSTGESEGSKDGTMQPQEKETIDIEENDEGSF